MPAMTVVKVGSRLSNRDSTDAASDAGTIRNRPTPFGRKAQAKGSIPRKPFLQVRRGSWHSDHWRAIWKGGILRFRPSRSEVPAVKSPRSTSIPKTMQGTYNAVVALTDTFCRENLNDYGSQRPPGGSRG
jgi:hypothetical protein